MATNKDISLQLWIANDAYFLPKKYVIIDKKDEFKQYAITFTEWDLNPDLPEALFSFDPPPNARNIAIMAK